MLAWELHQLPFFPQNSSLNCKSNPRFILMLLCNKPILSINVLKILFIKNKSIKSISLKYMNKESHKIPKSQNHASIFISTAPPNSITGMCSLPLLNFSRSPFHFEKKATNWLKVPGTQDDWNSEHLKFTFARWTSGTHSKEGKIMKWEYY